MNLRIKNTPFYIVSFIAILVFIYPCLKGGLWLGHDVGAHFSRLLAVNEEIKHGQFPMLFDFFNDNQFGYAWNIYYPPLSSYIFAFTYPIKLFGGTELDQFKITCLIIYLICLLSSYKAAYYITGIKFTSILTSVIYCSCVYLANNYYIRLAVGEMLAYSIFPLLILSYLKFRSSGEFNLSSALILLMILLSNIPAFLVCLIFLSFMAALDFRLIFNKIHLTTTIKIMGSLILLSSFYTLPLIWSRMHDSVWAFDNIASDFTNMWRMAATASLFVTGDDAIISTIGVHTRSQRTIGMALFITFLMSLYVFRKQSKNTELQIAALFFSFISTSLFPWFLLPKSTPLLGLIQFPWRFLIIPSFVASLMSAKIIALVKRNNTQLALILFSILSLSSGYTTFNALLKRIHTQSEMVLFYRDYMPSGVRVSELLGKRNEPYINAAPSNTDVYYHKGYPNYIINRDFDKLCLPVFNSSLLDISMNGRKESKHTDEGLLCINGNDKEYCFRDPK